MNPEELVALNEQIAGMARAGLPLDQGLLALSREMGYGRLRSVTAAIGKDLQRGQTLPAALESHRGELPPYYASLAAAGIRTGRLSEVLCTLTRYARSIATTRNIVIEAIAYPTVVICLAIAIFVLLMVTVVPQLKSLFNEFRIPLPAPTQWALALADVSLYWVLVVLAAVVFGLLVLHWIVTRTEQGRRWWTWFVYSVPLLGTMVKSARLAAFSDLLAVMVEHEVPLPEAMSLAGEAGTDPYLAEQARDVRTRLEHGASLGEALLARDLLPEWVAWMAKAGERRGDLAGTLRQVADVYRRHVEARASVLRHALPSIMIILTAGLLIAGFAMVIASPFINLLEGLSK